MLLVLWKYYIFQMPLKYPPGTIFRVPIFRKLFYYYGDNIEASQKLKNVMEMFILWTSEVVERLSSLN